MPILSAIMAMIIFNEKFMFYHMLGAIFILTGILLSNKKLSYKVIKIIEFIISRFKKYKNSILLISIKYYSYTQNLQRAEKNIANDDIIKKH